MMLDKTEADRIHIDVMDGHFVPNITIGAPVIAAIRNATSLPFEVHLMIEKPGSSIKNFADAGSDIIIFHHESESDIEGTINTVKKHNKKVGMAISPGTPFDLVKEYAPSLDTILIMSVIPGFGGQEFIPESLEKIRQARAYLNKKGLDTIIAVDGGINADMGASAISAGANELIIGNSIFKSKNIPQTIRNFKTLAHG